MGVGWFAGQLCATTMVAVGVLAVVLNARLQQIEVPTSSSSVSTFMFDACVYVIAAASIDPAAASMNGRCFGRCRAAASMDISPPLRPPSHGATTPPSPTPQSINTREAERRAKLGAFHLRLALARQRPRAVLVDAKLARLLFEVSRDVAHIRIALG